MTEHDLTESQLVGSRIRDARINRRMSQADLAAKANISLPHVSNIEKGKTSMKLETFIRIIEALQVSADSLLRPDVPEVRSLYQSEFDELLADCSPKELDSILKIVRELKSTSWSDRRYSHLRTIGQIEHLARGSREQTGRWVLRERIYPQGLWCRSRRTC